MGKRKRKTLYQRAKRHGVLISRLSRGKFKFTDKRIIIWKKDKVTNWINKKEWSNLRKEISYDKRRTPDKKYKMKIKPTKYSKTLKLKAKRRQFEIIVYSDTQAEFLKQELHKRRIPIAKKKTKMKKSEYADLKENFKMAKIQVSKLHEETP